VLDPKVEIDPTCPFVLKNVKGATVVADQSLKNALPPSNTIPCHPVQALSSKSQ